MQALMVSGEDGLVRRFTTALAEVGVSVEAVPHTGAGLAALMHQRFEAVLVDCDLEGGMDLLHLVREDERNRRAIVLACAGSHEAAGQAGRMGANFVLNKPINWEMAKRTLRAAQTMIVRERRATIREKLCTPAQITYKGQNSQANLVDMSESGLSLQTEHSPAIGSQLQIEFKLPGGRRPVQCTSKVVWARNGHIGVQFLYLSASNAEMIMSWLTHHSPRHRTAAS